MHLSDITARDSRRARVILFAATILYWCSMYTYVPILSPYLESIDFSYAAVGIVLGSYGLMQLIIRFPLGLLSDRVRLRKPFILLGFLTSALGCLMFVIFDDLVGVTAARAMTGVAASSWVAFTVLYASYYSISSASKAMSVISSATVIGQLLGMGVSGFLADWQGPLSTFWLGGIVAVTGGVLALFVYEPKGGAARTPIAFKDLAAVTKSRTLLRSSTLSVFAHGIMFITMFGFTPLYAVSIGASGTELSLLVFAFLIPHAFSSWLSGYSLAPRIGPWRVAWIGFLVSGAATLTIPFIPQLSLLYVTQAFNGFAQGMTSPMLMGIAIQSVAADKRATAMGFYQAVYSAGMFAGPFMAGWLNESFGLTAGFVLGGLFAATAAILIIRWGKSDESMEN